MNTQKGFTLMETLIALVLMSLLVMALFGGFRAGLRSWQTAENHVAWIEEPRQLSALLYRHLSQFVPVSNGLTVAGITHVFAAEPERLLYVAPLAMSVGGEPYVIELTSRYNGQPGLWARFVPWTVGQTALELLEEAEYVQVSESITVQFSYFFQDEWVAILPAGQLPALVKVNLNIESEREWPSLVFALHPTGSY